MATMNTGMDTPKREKPMKSLSSRLFSFMAAMMPQTMPMSQATTAAARARHTVLGKAWAIREDTLTWRE